MRLFSLLFALLLPLPALAQADRLVDEHSYAEPSKVRIGHLALDLEIDFAKIPRVPNTRNAHRLIHWAGQEGQQSRAVSALFRAYWREGRDIGDLGTLADIAAESGLDRDVIARLLATDSDLDAVQARDGHARERGINAVPTFVVDNQYVLSGAQPPALWGQVIDELSAQSSSNESR